MTRRNQRAKPPLSAAPVPAAAPAPTRTWQVILLVIGGIVTLAVTVAQSQFTSPVVQALAPKALRQAPHITITNSTIANSNTAISLPSDSGAQIDMNNVQMNNNVKDIDLRDSTSTAAKPASN